MHKATIMRHLATIVLVVLTPLANLSFARATERSSDDPASPSVPAPKASLPRVTVGDLAPEARSLASKRAKFVYRLPDGSVWDSTYYIEFRQVLSDFDALSAKAVPTGKVAAWGFQSGSRRPANKDKRPDPLWGCRTPKKEDAGYTPFIYVNTSLLSSKEAAAKTHFKLGKEVSQGVYEFSFTEFPAEQNALGTFPMSISLGYSVGIVRVPAGLHPDANGVPLGEFFVLSDRNSPASTLVFAKDLRLTPDAYAAALVNGEAELVEWSFKRETSRLGETFQWARRVIEPTSKRNAVVPPTTLEPKH